MTKRNLQRGFNLIEMLVVIAIIGILVALAMPKYQDYAMRSRWKNALQAVGTIKFAIAECTQFEGTLSTSKCNTLTGLWNSGYLENDSTLHTKYGAKVTVERSGGANGTPYIKFDAGNATGLGECILYMVPSKQNVNTINWRFISSSSPKCTRRKTGLDISP